MIRTDVRARRGHMRRRLWLRGLEQSEMTTIHQTSNFSPSDGPTMLQSAVCTSIISYPFQTVSFKSKQTKHGTTPITTVLTPMLPGNCCSKKHPFCKKNINASLGRRNGPWRLPSLWQWCTSSITFLHSQYTFTCAVCTAIYSAGPIEL